MFLDELDGSWPPIFDLFLFMQIAGGWQHNPIDISLGMFNGILQGEGRPHIVFCRKVPMHMTGANSEFQHHRCIACLRQLKAFFHSVHNAGQIGPGV